MSVLDRRWIFAVLLLSLGIATSAQDPTVALRDEATVQGETVQLADLLPLGVSATTRLAAQKIGLGRAPEPGSMRVFSREELRSAVAGEMAVTFPSRVLVRGAGWPLRDASIRRALGESEMGRGYDFSSAKLVPPADFATRGPDPHLEVLAIHPESDARKLSASLRCQQRSDCGSFLVEIVFDEPAPARTEKSSRARRPGASKSGPRNFSDVAVRQVALVQPGRPARMLFEGEGFKITTRVMPLQRAGMGQTVRVFDPAARQVSLAEVKGKDVVSFRGAR
jgi:hypothetical protein